MHPPTRLVAQFPMQLLEVKINFEMATIAAMTYSGVSFNSIKNVAQW